MYRFSIWVLSFAVCLNMMTAAMAQSQSSLTAEQRLEGLLSTMGGRKAWASLTGVRVTATHHTSTVRLPFKNVIWNDFKTPRLRIESANEEINRALVWQKSGGSWTKRDAEELRALTAQQEIDEARWWESNPYRTIQRLAARDEELSVKLIDADRLGVFRSDGVRLCWFRLNQLNEPIAFGTWDAEDGTIFGPLREANFGVRHPKWTARPDGRWRAELVEFVFYRNKMNIETAQPNAR